MLILSFFVFLFIQSPIHKINSNELKTAALSFVNEVKIPNNENAFYTGIMIQITKNEQIVIFDKGNSQFNIYDIKGKKLRVFGKEGNGPGELSQVLWFFTSNNRILVIKALNMLIFDINGNLINVVKGDFTRYSIDETSNQIRFVSPLILNNKIKSITLSLNGEQLSTKENEYYKPDKKRNVNNIIKGVEESYDKANGDIEYGDKYLQNFKGSYKFQLVEKSGKVIKTFTRDYPRLKLQEHQFVNFKIQKDWSKKRIKQALELKAKYHNTLMKVSNGYQDDIDRILGLYKNFILIKTASPVKELLRIDVLDSNFNLYTTYEKKYKDFQNFFIKKNKAIFEMINDDIGPYTIISDIQID
jgi:hypothetical protein